MTLIGVVHKPMKFLKKYTFTPAVLLLLNIGCFNPFAPELDNSLDLSNVITEQQSPEEVLENFSFAYTFKDSLLYSNVLDESFVFEFFDTNLQPALQRDKPVKVWVAIPVIFRLK